MMEPQQVEQQLRALRTPSRRIFTALYKCSGWMTRKSLAQAIGHATLFMHDRALLAEMVRSGLVEEDAQDLEITVRYRYRIPEEVRSALQQIIAERKTTSEQVEVR